MKIRNVKILLPLAGMLLVVVSILAYQNLLAGIGIGIAGMLVFGPNVEDIRGKTGGIVYSKNKSGPYTKVRVKGRNPQSDAQMVNRMEHKRLMQLWKSPEVDKVAYNDYAASHPVPNKVGRMVYLSGINWFVKINRYAKKANPGCGLITRPSEINTQLPVIKSLQLNMSTQPDSVTIEPIKKGEYTGGMRLQVFATPQLSAGVFSAKGFREIGIYDPSLSDTIDISADYVERYGSLQAGMKVFVKARILTDIGEAGVFMGNSTIIVNNKQ